MRELDNNAHSVFLLYYHLILVVKYRKKVLNDPISDRAREIFEYIAPKYHITLEEWNHDEDHVLEGNVLESEFLPPECRRSSDRSDPSVHRDTGGEKT